MRKTNKMIERPVNEQDKIYLDCECGTHILQVTNDIDYYDHDNGKRFHQEFWFSMFTYGTYHKKPNFWRRIAIIWNYLKTGKMHEDQIILNPEDAKKLAKFINEKVM
jgi:hypothetical protein